MAAILVDYENVCFVGGLSGVEYLTKDDTLYIFYSEACMKIKKSDFDVITASGCNFQTVKLKRQGRNGLDFYIASECGVLAETGEKKIAIISRDKGFSAVVDFFQKSKYKILVTTAGNIGDGIAKLNITGRSETIRECSTLINLEKEYAVYESKKAEEKKITDIFGGTAYESQVADIVELLEVPEMKESPAKLYRECMHRYGLASGREIYRILKRSLSGPD